MTTLHRLTDAVTLRDGRRLGYAEWGSRSRDAATVLYFHGAMGSPMRRCAATDAALQTLGLRYVMVHRPGFGASDPQPGRTLTDWPADVAQLADALRHGALRRAGRVGRRPVRGGVRAPAAPTGSAPPRSSAGSPR